MPAIARHTHPGVFTSQLDASNPVLTDIADAMTAEAEARRRLEDAIAGSACALHAMHAPW
jgi:hypothetical protein